MEGQGADADDSDLGCKSADDSEIPYVNAEERGTMWELMMTVRSRDPEPAKESGARQDESCEYAENV